MTRDPFASYDAWLEKPYIERAEQAERMSCPECDGPLTDDGDGGVECECGYSYGPDWDAVAEARAEARAWHDEHEGDVW